MTKLQERLFPFQDGTDNTLLVVSDPKHKLNSKKVHGLWLLFVSEAAYEGVIRKLYLMVEEAGSRFVAVTTETSPEKLIQSMRMVCLFDEGSLYRRQLWTSLDAFDEIGVEGHWLYIDGGAERHKSARRVLTGEGPQSAITEIDLRGDGEEPVIRHPVRGR